jgi:hypothetical protein
MRDGVRGLRELQAYIFGKAAEIDITKNDFFNFVTKKVTM